MTNSRAEPFSSASFGLGGLFFAVLRRRGGLERVQQPSRDTSHLVDRGEKRGFVGLGRLVEPGDLSYKLDGGRANLLVGNRWIEVEECFDIPAHGDEFLV